MFNGKSILITGGTGSFGKQFVKTCLEKYHPERLIVYSRDELKQYEMQQRFPDYGDSPMRYFLGDVRDLQRLKVAMEDVDYVIHAAALKQVPAAEYNPFEAVKTNVIGGKNVIDAARSQRVKRIIALSTDKAAAPINLYGATKLASDKLFIAANNYVGKRDTRFSVVRYGNVMASRGSVIPFFIQKKEDGVIPITDERMTRFNITLEHAVDFVIRAFDMMVGGEIFVPKIPSYRITDLAQAIAPNCEHKIVGIRAGEKIHEEMVTETDALSSIEYDDFFIIFPHREEPEELKENTMRYGSKGKHCEYGFSYHSGNNPHFLTIPEIQELVKSIE